MSELVRYIHLNPVRARMVEKVEDYPYSSQREYLGLRPSGIVDVDPILRLFGAKRDIAREQFAQYVAAGISQGHREKFDLLEDGRILGSEEFVDSTIHRIGEASRPFRPSDGRLKNGSGKFDPRVLIAAVESVCGVSSEVFCGPTKSARATAARDVLIVAGRRLGATVRELSQITGINSSNVSRRHDAAVSKHYPQGELYDPTERVLEAYQQLESPNIAIRRRDPIVFSKSSVSPREREWVSYLHANFFESALDGRYSISCTNSTFFLNYLNIYGGFSEERPTNTRSSSGSG